MQATFIHDGKSIDYTPEMDISAGSVIVQNNLIGITKLEIKAGRLGALAVVGVFDVVKGNTAIPIGSKVYWDNTAKQVTLTATNNALLGITVQESTAEDTVVRVRLG